MPSLNIDLNYFEHPKVKRLIAICGKEADVYPPRLWAYCGKYHMKDGHLNGYSDREIEAIMGWGGEPGLLIKTMLEIGLLERQKEGIWVHDWIQHEGHLWYYKVRAIKASSERWKKCRNASSNASSNAKRGGLALLKTPLSNASSNAKGGGLAMLLHYITLQGIPLHTKEEVSLDLANVLHNAILVNDPKAKLAEPEQWQVDIEKLIEKDKRPPELIKDVIIWTQKHNFWKIHILSAKKLREKFTALYINMQQEKNKNGKANGSTSAAELKYKDVYE